MSHQVNAGYSVHFPKEKYTSWHVFTPSYFSTYFIVLFRAAIRCYLGTSDVVHFIPPPSTTHTFHVSFVHGMETLEINAISSSPDNEYLVYCCGMEENAMDFDVSTIKPNQNAIIFNYPSKGRSKGQARSAKDMIRATIRQVKRLLNKGIPANKITLYGYSLGGAVAIKAARKLHQEGYPVNVTVERSFAQFSSVIPALINKIDAKKTPLVTSILALAVSGFTFGVAFAGSITSLGHLAAGSLDGIAYISAYLIRLIGLFLQEIINLLGDVLSSLVGTFNKDIGQDIKNLFYNVSHYVNSLFQLLTKIIQKSFSIAASFTAGFVNLAASLIGGVIAVSGLILGAVTGTTLGILLSIQLLWTNKPLTLSVIPAFRGLLYTFRFEMDSVSELKKLLAENVDKEKAEITIINTVDDEVIDHSVALNTGLGLKPENNHHSSPLKEKVTSFWYNKGGHRGKLDDPLQTSACDPRIVLC